MISNEEWMTEGRVDDMLELRPGPILRNRLAATAHRDAAIVDGFPGEADAESRGRSGGVCGNDPCPSRRAADLGALGAEEGADHATTEGVPLNARHVMAIYASEADGPALDHAVALVIRREARLTIAVPVVALSSLVYTSPFAIDPLAEDLEREAERNANVALRRVPREVSVTARFIKVDRARDALEEVLPVDLIVYHPSSQRGSRRTLSALMRAARRLGVAVGNFEAVGN